MVSERRRENVACRIRVIVYKDVKLLFPLFDADRNGQLNKEEVKQLVSMVTGSLASNDDIAKVIELVDTNSNILYHSP